MLSITIEINDEELYRVDAYLQEGGDLGGICTYKIVTNDVDAGVVQHDRTDGAWVLARRVLDTFSAPEKTLQEEGGAHTAFHSPNSLRRALDAYRDELVYGKTEGAALWKHWTDNPGELGKALLDPDGAGLSEFERVAAARLRARLT